MVRFVSMRSSKSVCDRLIDLIHGGFITNSRGQAFISKALLNDVLTRSRVIEALQCSCDSCKHQRSGLRVENLETICQWILDSAQRLFALLAYTHCLQLIDGFFEKDHTDDSIEWDVKQLTADQITRSFWKFFVHKDPIGSDRLASQVRHHKYQFFVPTLNDRIYDVNSVPNFDTDVILPIIRESSIDKGGYGRVTEIQLFNEYTSFESINSSIDLVRKEVDLSSQIAQSEELDILLYVKNLEDDHVVRLVSAYKQDNKINYIFPKATTNLKQYLRNNGGTFAPNTPRIESHPLWQQFLGVLRALYRIYSDVHQTSSGAKVKLYHFDLKPENILVDVKHGQPCLLVTDFGFSRSQVVTTYGISTKLIGFGGTPAYAPPEIENLHRQRNHRYDIWSLGCILLEICAFIVDGPNGVKSLDDARYTRVRTRGGSPGDNECWDDYFWHSTTVNDFEIKPAVMRWMSRLPHSPNVTSNAASDFLKDIMDLSTHMLNVNISERLDAETAQHRLAMILKPKALRPESAQITIMLPIDEPPGSFFVGLDELERLEPVNCKYDKFFDNVRLRLHENFRGFLFLQLWSGQVMVREVELGPRDSVSLMSHPALITQNRVELHLLLTKDPQLRWLRLYLCNAKETAILQSVLLGQAVRSFSTAYQKCLLIKSLKVEQYCSRGSRFSRKFGPKDRSSSAFDKLGRPQVVQFWCEKSYSDTEAVERVRPRKGSRRTAIQLLDRRLVVFCEKALVFITFAKNWRLQKPLEKYTGLLHRLVPTDQSKSSRDPSFEVVVLSSDVTGLCQIPLDRKKLGELQRTSAFECASLELEFANRQNWQDFQVRYQTLKREWKADYEVLMNEQKYSPEDLGYGTSL